jgi:hypothetical protein
MHLACRGEGACQLSWNELITQGICFVREKKASRQRGLILSKRIAGSIRSIKGSKIQEKVFGTAPLNRTVRKGDVTNVVFRIAPSPHRSYGTVSFSYLFPHDQSMRSEHTRVGLKIGSFLALLGLVLIANSCGHTATAAPPIPITLVSQAIHQYGSGQRVLPSTDKPTEPDETSELYRAHISNFLVQGDYAQLETIAERNRTEKGRLLGGFWKNYEFFTATGYLSSTAGIKDTDFHDQMNMLNKWIAAYPQSAATHISLAELYVNYADFAPGSGYANSVSSSQWRLYNERTTLAERALIEAAGLKERDPTGTR